MDPEMDMAPEADAPPGAESPDAAGVLKALHEALEIAFGDDALKAALLANPTGSWEFGDDGSLTLTVGDATKTIAADEMDAALAGDEPVDVPDEE